MLIRSKLEYGAFLSSSIQNIRNITGEKPLKYRRTLYLLKYIYNLATTPSHPNFSTIFKRQDNSTQIKDLTKIQKSLLQLTNDFNLTIPSTILGNSISFTPPWLINEPQCNLELACYKKQDTSSSFYLQEFRRLQEKYTQHRSIYTDASKIEDSLGAAIILEEETTKFRLPTPSSIFTAEITSIQKAIQLIENQNLYSKEYALYTDSLSAIQEIKNIYPKKTITQEIQQSLHNIKTQQNTNVTFVWIPSHVGIAGNNKADEAAKEASKNDIIEKLPIQLYDAITTIKKQLNNKYVDEWAAISNNKLKTVKRSTDPWTPNFTRKQQIAITRLRIGHTRISHSHLFRKEPPDMCNTCNTRITVQHLITECQKYSTVRQKYKIADNLQEALKNDRRTEENIIQYLTDTNLMNLI